MFKGVLIIWIFFLSSKSSKYTNRQSINKKTDQRKPAFPRSATSLGTRKNENRSASNVKSANKKDDRPLSSKADATKDKTGDQAKQNPKDEQGKSADDDERKFECHGLDRELADMLGRSNF